MRHRLHFERQSSSPDATGQPTRSWSAICDRMAALEDLNGREFLAASGEHAEITTRIRVRYDSTVATVSSEDRVVDYSRSPAGVYQIVSPPINPDRRDQEIVLMARRVT